MNRTKGMRKRSEVKRAPHRWVGVERGGTLMLVPELASFGGDAYEEALEECRAEVEFKHPKLAPARTVYFVDVQELELLRRMAKRVYHLMGSYQIRYTGIGPVIRDEAFRLLRKAQNGTLSDDDFPKTWGQLLRKERKKGRTT